MTALFVDTGAFYAAAGRFDACHRGAAVAFKAWAPGCSLRVIGVSSRDFSSFNCTSFAAMERLNIDEAFTFDVHFRIYRAGPSRSKAFRIIP